MAIIGTGELSLHPSLTKTAQQGHILSNLNSSSLIALGPLCDDGCKVVLTDKTLAAVKNNKVVLRGYRNRTDSLWDIPLYPHTRIMNNVDIPRTHSALYVPPHRRDRPPDRGKVANVTQSPTTSTTKTKPKKNFKVQFMTRQRVTKLVEQQLRQDEKDDFLQVPIHAESQKISVIIRKKETKKNLARYLHAACFSPVQSTWEQAIKNKNFATWPGLTTTMIKQHLPPSTATVQGHLHKQRQNLQSTTKKIKPSTKKEVKQEDSDDLNDYFPTPELPVVKSNHVAYVLIDKSTISTAYQDLTGRFPYKSASGNEYVLIGYHYDANCIIGHPVKDRKATTLTKAWQNLHDEFTNSGNKPEVWVLDNEVSGDLKQAFNKNDTKFQLVPPNSHRRNLAERAIQTWKNHFKAGIASVNPNFPMSEWDRLIPQANLTLNLLRNARVNPGLSAYEYVYGTYDFKSTPIAPPGTKVVAHIDTTKRGTWELNGEVGWYIGPALDHYRCVTCYFPRTRTTRVCETVTFIPHDIPFPKVTLKDHLQQAAEDIIKILTHPPAPTVPSLEAGDPVRNALLDIAQQLKRVDAIPTDGAQVTQETRVPSVTKQSEKDAAAPRVPIGNEVPIERLQQHSTTPQRVRIRNEPTHKYNLRSRTTLPWNDQQSFRSRATQQLVAIHLFQPVVHHIYRPDGKKETIDTLLQGSDRKIWTQSLSNEWGRLAQGNDNGVVSTDTIDFIHKEEVPDGRDVTYATFVLDYRPLKSEPHRVRITVGGDKLSYTADAGSPAANMLETKVLVNSTISDAHKGAKFMSADLKDFFLATPMEGDEYMKVPYKHFPQDIRLKYKLDSKVTNNGYIYIKIKKGMYGLKQAAILAYDQLRKNLEKHGYTPIAGTVGMWQHDKLPTKFCVCVDDFGIKYYNEKDADHLINCLKKYYKVTTDRAGRNYCGLTLDWNYKEGYVDVSMPGYVRESLQRLLHKILKYPQYSPHAHQPIRYGKKGARQYATTPDTSPTLSPKETKHIQSIAGSFLFYGRAIDSTILPALNEIASMQSKPTEQTKAKAQQLMDYLHTHPDAYIRYHANDMVLHVDSDAAYLVAPHARSRIAGYFYLSEHPNITKHPKMNGAILVECKTLRHVVSSSAEAEVAGIYHNAGMALPIRHMLEALQHPQPPTPLVTDNSTATGFIYDNIHQKRSKSWDMRFHWLRDRETQRQFNIHWKPGVNNKSDYFTKHHATVHHREQRPIYVKDRIVQFLQRRCSARVC